MLGCSSTVSVLSSLHQNPSERLGLGSISLTEPTFDRICCVCPSDKHPGLGLGSGRRPCRGYSMSDKMLHCNIVLQHTVYTRPRMCVCVYIYIYIYIYAHTHTHTWPCAVGKGCNRTVMFNRCIYIYIYMYIQIDR